MQLADGYHDHWHDLDDYLDFLYQRLALMYRLLSPNGLYIFILIGMQTRTRVLNS